MEIKLKKFQEIYILILDGELDLYNAPALEKVFQTLIKKGITSIILDFDKVSYIDSSGVGILLKLNSISKSKKIDFILSGVEGEVYNVLKLSNLIQFFPNEADYQTAVKKLLKTTSLQKGMKTND